MALWQVTQLAELMILLWERAGKFIIARKNLGAQKSNLILDNPFVKSMLNSASGTGGKSDLRHFKKNKNLQLKQLRWG